MTCVQYKLYVHVVDAFSFSGIVAVKIIVRPTCNLRNTNLWVNMTAITCWMLSNYLFSIVW